MVKASLQDRHLANSMLALLVNELSLRVIRILPAIVLTILVKGERIWGALTESRLRRYKRFRFIVRHLTFTTVALMFWFPSTMVLAAVLGKYEALAFFAAVAAYVLRTEIVHKRVSEPLNRAEHNDLEGQTRGSDSEGTVVTGGENAMKSDATLVIEEQDGFDGHARSSVMSVSICYAIVFGLSLYFSIYGLGVLDPPTDKLTPDLLQSSESTLLRFDQYLGKVVLINALAIYRAEFFSRWLQVVVLVVHVAIITAVWYGWRASTPQNGLLYVGYLSTDVWGGRHLCFTLLIMAIVLQHSLTTRRSTLEKLGVRVNYMSKSEKERSMWVAL